MNHRKRGGGKALIKVRAVIFFSQEQWLLGNAQPCGCPPSTAGTAGPAGSKHSVRSHTWERMMGRVWKLRLLNRAALAPSKCHWG